MQPGNYQNYPPGYSPNNPYQQSHQNGNPILSSYLHPPPQYPGQPNYPSQPGFYGQAPQYFGQGPPPPLMPRGPPPMMMPMPPQPNMIMGATIVKGPSLQPPPGWKPSITSVSSTSSSLIRQPITLYIGKIPESLSDAILQKVLECCGRVQKWNRPVDANTQAPKAFGFVTFDYGINALRCMNVLPTIDIDGAPLQLKAATKEQAALDALTEEEKLTGDEGTTIYEQQQIKQNILSLLSLHYKEHHQSVDDLTESLLAAATSSTSHNILSSITFSDTSSASQTTAEFNLDPLALSEIEKFRLRQAQRDKELEQKRISMLSDKILAYQRQQQDIADRPKPPPPPMPPSSSNYGELLIDNTGKDEKNRRDHHHRQSSIGERRSRDDDHDQRQDDDDDEAEAKRHRKQQVLRMLAGDSEAIDAQPQAVKVKLAPSSSSSMSSSNMTKKSIINTSSSSSNLNNITSIEEYDEDDMKPKRLPVPIDYSEDELKEVGSYQYHPPSMEDDDDLHDKLVKRNQTPAESAASVIANASMNAMKQAQVISFASSKAAEIAAKISNDMKLVSHMATASSMKAAASINDDDIQKQRQKMLVDQIPTEKNAIFDYVIIWDKIDAADMINKSMKPWIQKKVVEYLGEEEETLMMFIVSKLHQHFSPRDLLTELEPVLDEDAEPFVIKLWRMLIFMMLKD